MSEPATTQQENSRLDRFLNGIERIGNRLPEPFILFVLLTLLVAVVSTVMAAFGVAVTIPGEDAATPIRGIHR